VNPEHVESQIIGQIIQAVSWAFEEVRFNTKATTSLDWVSYPILRFKDHPSVTPIIVSRPELVPGGAGDFVNSYVPAAIANAFFDATGVRIRHKPMTPAHVRAVLKASAAA
jgi:CO/xanthine dehydrogenase Mo-binding subunit